MNNLFIFLSNRQEINTTYIFDGIARKENVVCFAKEKFNLHHCDFDLLKPDGSIEVNDNLSGLFYFIKPKIVSNLMSIHRRGNQSFQSLIKNCDNDTVRVHEDNLSIFTSNQDHISQVLLGSSVFKSLNPNPSIGCDDGEGGGMNELLNFDFLDGEIINPYSLISPLFGHNVAKTISMLCFMVSFFPDIEDMIVKELKLLSNPYIERCVLEILRMFPVKEVVERKAVCCTAMGSHKIEEDSKIIFPCSVVSNNKILWGEDLDLFNPDRKINDVNHLDFIASHQEYIQILRITQMLMKNYTLRCRPRYEETMYKNKYDFDMVVFYREDYVPHAIVVKEKEHIETEVEPQSIETETDTQSMSQPINRKMCILYGSNTGTSKDIAFQYETRCVDLGYETKCCYIDNICDDIGTPKLEEFGSLVVVCATYNGEPPDNAVQFCQWIESNELLLSKGTRFAVFACGDTDYPNYLKIPKVITKALIVGGGVEIQGMGEGNVKDDFEEILELWTYRLFSLLPKIEGEVVPMNTHHQRMYDVRSTVEKSTFVEREEGNVANVRTCHELQSEVSTRNTKHIEFCVNENYLPGDHMLIYPKNSMKDVTDLAHRVGLSDVDLGEVVVIDSTRLADCSDLPLNQPIKILELLQNYLDLFKSPSSSAFKILADQCPCPPEAERLRQYSKDSKLYKKTHIITA